MERGLEPIVMDFLLRENRHTTMKIKFWKRENNLKMISQVRKRETSNQLIVLKLRGAFVKNFKLNLHHRIITTQLHQVELLPPEIGPLYFHKEEERLKEKSEVELV